ncbi:MAG: NAD(P)-dependent oxidoreductase [Bacteroidota bacterium]
MKITFIGLGIMGKGMVSHLHHADWQVTIYNRTRTKAEGLGFAVADSLAEAVQEADIVISMLTTPEVVGETALGENGFVRHMAKGALWADCSTVHPAFSRQCGAAATAAGIRFIDSPVAGSKNQAAGAELVFLVGGEQADVDQFRPLMEVMGKAVVHAGKLGQGSSLKLLVNAMLGQSMAMFAEIMSIGQAMDLDRDFLLNFLPKLPVVPAYMQFKTDNMKAGSYPAEFPLELMHKDLHLLNLAAFDANIAVPLTAASAQRFAEANAAGMGREDFSAIFERFNPAP